MVETAGFTLIEIQAPVFTDENLAGLMRSFYAGTLDIVVNPGQGTAAGKPGLSRTLSFNLEVLAEDIEAATRRVLKPLGSILDLSPLILLGGITTAVLLLARKAK